MFPLHAPPIYHPPLIKTVMTHQTYVDDVTVLTREIFKGVCGANNHCILLRVGDFTLEPFKINYDVSDEVITQTMAKCGEIGIATKLVVGEYIPKVGSGYLYIFATNNPKAAELTKNTATIKLY